MNRVSVAEAAQPVASPHNTHSTCGRRGRGIGISVIRKEEEDEEDEEEEEEDEEGEEPNAPLPPLPAPCPMQLLITRFQRHGESCCDAGARPSGPELHVTSLFQ